MSVSERLKGKVAEREVAHLHEAWWGSLEPGCRFVSTPQSGGWSAPTVRAEFRASGDLMTTATRFPFCVEVKRREKWSLEWLQAGKASPVWGWWRQAQRAAVEAELEPVLWFRRSREPWWVLVRAGFADERLPFVPELRWAARRLRALDVGALPVGFLATELLGLGPIAVAK